MSTQAQAVPRPKPKPHQAFSIRGRGPRPVLSEAEGMPPRVYEPETLEEEAEEEPKTPPEEYVLYTDICDICEREFEFLAPEAVAEMAAEVWLRKHACEGERKAADE